MLDIKWNPFIENIIASCSEDTSVSWDASCWRLREPCSSEPPPAFNLYTRRGGKRGCRRHCGWVMAQQSPERRVGGGKIDAEQ